MDDGSTRYSSFENQKSADSRRDALEAVFGPRRVSLRKKKTAAERIAERSQGRTYRLTMTTETSLSSTGAVLPIPQTVLDKHRRHARHRAALAEALDVLKSVAAQDADGAQKMNRVGFSKSDTSHGHRLARLQLERVMKDRTLSEEVLSLAKRYRGQATALRQRDLFE